jgi:hypothetical protein
MPLGKNNSDINNGGKSYRGGTPLTVPHEFGNPVTQGNDPTQFGNPIPSSGTNENRVTWTVSPSHFGNIIAPPSPAPTVTSMNTTTGPITGGTSVGVVGTGFQTGAEVLFGTEPATSVLVVSSTLIVCHTPAGTSGETVTVEVINPDSQSGSLPNAFTYWSAPTVNFVFPSDGPTAGGTGVLISGTGFQPGFGTGVTFGGVSATSVVVNSSTQIHCTVPAGSLGSVTVTVTNFDAQSGSKANAWTYVAAPTFTSVSPNNGLTTGGTPVAIVGSGFTVPDLSVTFGGNPVTSLVVIDDNNLTCDSPAGSAGLTDIEIITDGGSVDTPNAWTYNVPAIALLAHSIGSGLSFNTGITTPAIDSTGATMLVIAASGYTIVPQQAGGHVTVTDSNGNTYKQVPNGRSQPQPGVAVFYCPNPVVGSGHTATVTFGDSGAGGYVSLSAWSNTHSLVPLAQNSNSGGTNIPAPFQGGSVAAGLAGDLILSFISGYNGFSTNTGLPAGVDSGLTIFDSIFSAGSAAGSGTGGLACGYLVTANTTPVNPTWTMQAAVTGAMVTNVIFAKASTAGVQLVNSVSAASGSAVTTPAINTTGANFLVAMVAKYASTGGPAVFSDSKGNTWHQVAWTNGQDYGKPKFYYAYNATVGTGHTFSTTDTDVVISVLAFSGVKASSDPLESGNDTAAISGSNTYQAGAAITPASAGDLVVTCLGNIFATDPNTVFLSVDQDNLTSGWSPINGNDPAGAIAFSIAQDNTTALQPTWTGLISGGQFNRGYVNLAVFAHA